MSELSEWKDLYSTQQTCQAWRIATHMVPSFQQLYFLAPEPPTDGVGHEILGPRDGPRLIFVHNPNNTELDIQWDNLDQGDTRSIFPFLGIDTWPRTFYEELMNSVNDPEYWPRELEIMQSGEVCSIAVQEGRVQQGEIALSVYHLRKALYEGTIDLAFFYKGMTTLRAPLYDTPNFWYGWHKPCIPHGILHPLAKQLGVHVEYVGYAGYVAYFAENFRVLSLDLNGPGVIIPGRVTFFSKVRKLYQLPDTSWRTQQLLRPTCQRLYFVCYRPSSGGWARRTDNQYYRKTGITLVHLIQLAIRAIRHNATITLEEADEFDSDRLESEIKRTNALDRLILRA